MNKLYNTDCEISRDLEFFFKGIDYKLSKPQIKTLTEIILGMIKSESVVTADIAKHFKTSNNLESSCKKISRFFNSKLIDYDSLYESIIRNIINKAKFKHDKVYICLDHTFERNKFVTLAITIRVNNQCILAWHYSEKVDKTFKDHEEVNDKKPIYSTKKINAGISKVASYFKESNVQLIFLADRWFQNTKIFDHISKLGHSYAFRLKANSNLSVKVDAGSKNKITKPLSSFKFQKCHTQYFEKVKFSNSKIPSKLVLGMTKGLDDPYAIATNNDSKYAIKDYNKRFGAIETLFKNSKTGGFNLERTKTQNLDAYNILYTVLNIALLWLVTIGTDYVKNRHHYINRLNIRITKTTKNKKIKKIISDFNLGLTIFTKLINSKINYKIKTTFLLYI